jgi:hypothetical protein
MAYKYNPISGQLDLVSDLTFTTITAGLGYTPVNVLGDTMLGNLILNADPTTALGAATKQYVDNIAIGLNFHAPVLAATTAPLPSVIYNNGIAGVGATLIATAPGALSIDTVSFTGGERVLIKDQVSGLENGIYVVNVPGDGSTPFELERATDADNSPSGELTYGDFCFVQQGLNNGALGYILNTTGTIILGTTSISYVVFNAGQVVTAGYGLLELTPSVLSVDTSIILTASAAALAYYPLSSNPAGYLTSGSLSGYVPYTGATANVDLDTYTLKTSQLNISTKGSISSSGTNTLLVNNTAADGTTKVQFNGVDSLILKGATTSNTASLTYTKPTRTGLTGENVKGIQITTGTSEWTDWANFPGVLQKEIEITSPYYTVTALLPPPPGPSGDFYTLYINAPTVDTWGVYGNALGIYGNFQMKGNATDYLGGTILDIGSDGDGTIIGLTGAKLSFFGNSPIVQPTGITTVQGLSTALSNLGLIATSTLSFGTTGSVLFAGVSGALSQDNANFFWDDSNNRLGIGTNTPSKELTVVGDALFDQSKVTINQVTGTIGLDIVQSSEAMYQLSNSGTDWALVGKTPTEFYFYNQLAVPINFYTTATNRMSILSGGNVNIGNYATPSAQRILTVGQDSSWITMGSLATSVGVAAIYFNQTSPSGGGNAALSGTSTTTNLNGPSTLNLNTLGTQRLTITSAQTSGAVVGFTFTKPDNTNQTASTPVNGVLWTLGSRQWATGAITTQKEFELATPTYSFVGASTIANAYSLYVNAPTAGTNATITNNYALGVKGQVGLEWTSGGATMIIGDWGAFSTYGWGIITSNNLFRLPTTLYIGDTNFSIRRSSTTGIIEPFNNITLQSGNTTGGQKTYLAGIQSTGHVGIGTLTPTERLTISGGNVLIEDAGNLVVGSTTGTKIGTATTQKIGFFNATPIVQPAATTSIQGIATALSNLGLIASSTIQVQEVIQAACSDENTAITVGTAKVTFRMPYAMTLTSVRASLSTAQTSGTIFTIDVNQGGVSIFSTRPTIDNGEKTTTTAATPSVLSTTALTDDAEITVDVDQIGDSTAKGLKITLIGYRT